ncbi:MAG: homoserine kinase [Bacteroidetes bacterium]|nr:homoserine kinase [Bacteroidota bacterium]MDA1120072.1 homoserine kinase [Bacteroidota bacterium]
MADSIKVFAPASVGNSCVGFDVLGFAVEKPGDELLLRKTEKPGVVIKSIAGDNGQLSTNPTKNTATIAIDAFLKDFGRETGLEVELFKNMPFGSGLGSSAASAVAGAFAANELFGQPYPIEKVLEFAMEGEFFASGAHHADNVAPCLYGGMTLIRSNSPFDVIKIPVPSDLWVVLLYPEVEIKTSEARSLLPYEIPLKTASKQWGNVAGFIAGFMSNDKALISRSMKDYVAEPYRSRLIPGFNECKKSAMDAGAMGFSISGSGPTMFAFCTSEESALEIGKAMSVYYIENKIGHQLFISQINQCGPKVL